MNRRRFCKMVALAAGAVGLSPLESVAGSLGNVGGRRAVVTVLRRECFEDLQSLYLDDPETGRCQAFEPGESFVCGGDGCPDGFCPLAWQTVRRCIEDSAACAGSKPAERTLVAACPDGTRPVIFKIEL